MTPKETFELVLDYAKGVWRFRWIGMGFAWLTFIGAVAFVYSLPNKYEASSKVYVDTENLLRPLLKGLYVETNVMNDVAVMTRALVTRPHLEQVLRDTDLDVTVTTEGQREAMLKSLESRIDIKRSRENIYSIAFSDQSRGTALSVAEALLNTFVENTLGNSALDSDSAEETLRKQISEYEKRLISSEEKLKRFKQENVGFLPGVQGDYYAQLEANLNEQKQIELALSIAKEKQATIQRQLNGAEFEQGSSSLASSYDQQILELEKTRNDLLLEFTARHPEVVRANDLIEKLREKREEELAAGIGSSQSNEVVSLNPVYQNLQIQLSEANLEVVTLAAQRQNNLNEITRLRELVDVLPEVEARLTRLNRDYDVVQGRYQEMLSRWENLQTGRAVNSGRDSVTFRIIEPPYASTQPVSPNRNLLIAGCFVVALGAGVALAFLFSLLLPVISSEHSLRSISANVIGRVSYHLPEGQTAGLWQHVGFAAAGVALICLAGAALLYAATLSWELQKLLA